ncbi:para-nitrobenzyl esterase-like isoform X2 [Maniola jurtina]|uniref:para-nitrobenzyl esterase-like isoform X2 n=1 Tax=Maniola jurtina TaxID=191418 RepID=UPI001E687260|nr:para-nitrobenzyl esterase-like isoform X2 [Maniola jurtina]
MVIKLFRNLSVKIRSDSLLISMQSRSMADAIVTVKEGRLRGAVKNLYNSSDYYSFKGIPYAQPPVGKLRFKAPHPPQPWQGILDATKHGPVCPQAAPTKEILEGDENCLFLNIYTRSLKSDSKIPVMIYIHGGGFLSGSGDDELYGPKFLLNHKVILVTINYRLEVFGFLCLDTPEVPGNAGLKDQIAAFKWVRNNISQFGGDPENVTIFGESAGGASVTFNMLSSMSKGLFNKAISQSGVCLHDWAYHVDAKTRAFRIGKVLGKETNDTEELLEFLQSVPSKELIGMNYKVASEDEKRRGLPIRFGPVVEKKFDNTEAFLTENPLDLLISGKFQPVPLIIGYNSREGILLSYSELKKIDFTNKFPSFLVPAEIARKVSEEKLKEFGERIKAFYCPNRDMNSNDVNIISDIVTDIYFIHGIYRFSNFYSKFVKEIYMYRFNLDTELNCFKSLIGLTEYKGACHADELFYLFNNNMNEDIYEKKDNLRQYVHMMTKTWTDFAKTGIPTPDSILGVKWTPYTSRNKEYLSIDNELAMDKGAEKERLEFWTKLYSDAGLPSDIISKL